MNDKITVLRKKLTELFDQISAAEADKVPFREEPAADSSISKDISLLIGEVNSILATTLANNADLQAPDAEFLQAFGRVMAYHHFITHPAWEVRPDVTDQEILDAAKAIDAADLAALEHLRMNTTGYRMVYDMTYFRLSGLLSNIQYLYFTLAHIAKEVGSRSAAEKFLRVASLIRKSSTQALIYFPEERADEILQLAGDGVEELLIAIDYNALVPWETFRQKAEQEYRQVKALEKSQAGNEVAS